MDNNISKLLINNTLNVKGAILDKKDMINIVNYYKRASRQEYVYENASDGITAEDALKITDLSLEYERKYKWCEDDCIREARAELGFKRFAHQVI